MKKFAFTLRKVFLQHSNNCRKNAFTLVEVLVTLGIVGIIAALIIPQTLVKIEKQRNIANLKRAYNDLHQYLKMFDSEYDCNNVLTNCTPSKHIGDHTFVWEFSKYLHDKQKFYNPIGTIANKHQYAYKWLTFGNENISAFMSPVTNIGSYLLISPTGNYAYFVTAYMYDNTYGTGIPNDRFRARIFILTDTKHLGICRDFCTDKDKANSPKHGKNLFLAFITNFEYVMANGDRRCGNGYYCQTLNDNNCSKKSGNFGACLTKIIEDGWQIKYDY